MSVPPNPPRFSADVKGIESHQNLVKSSAIKFSISWILVNELAVGPAPLDSCHLKWLKAEGINGILSLCSTDELPEPDGLELLFNFQRVVLPRPCAKIYPSVEQLQDALIALAELRTHGAVYVHCLAAIERSPLVCMGWLMQQHGVSMQQALDYMQQIHSGTCPPSDLLAILNKLPLSANAD